MAKKQTVKTVQTVAPLVWETPVEIKAGAVSLHVVTHAPITRAEVPAMNANNEAMALLIQQYCAVEFGIETLKGSNAVRALAILKYAIDKKSYDHVAKWYKGQYAAYALQENPKADADAVRKAGNNSFSRLRKSAMDQGWNAEAVKSQTKRAKKAVADRAAASAGKVDGRTAEGKAAAGKAPKASAIVETKLPAELTAIVTKAQTDKAFKAALSAFWVEYNKATLIKAA